jgi:hypothetical protein
MLGTASGDMTVGAQGEVDAVLPIFMGGGHALGLNLQLTLDTLHGFGIGLFFYATPFDAPDSSGILAGGSIGGNIAYGRGDWSGAFDNIAGSIGPYGASVFSSSGWNWSGPGYAGVAAGLSWGVPVGGAEYTTTYYPIVGRR